MLFAYPNIWRHFWTSPKGPKRIVFNFLVFIHFFYRDACINVEYLTCLKIDPRIFKSLGSKVLKRETSGCVMIRAVERCQAHRVQSPKAKSCFLLNCVTIFDFAFLIIKFINFGFIYIQKSK